MCKHYFLSNDPNTMTTVGKTQVKFMLCVGSMNLTCNVSDMLISDGDDSKQSQWEPNENR